MILQIDAGNSRMHWRVLTPERAVKARGDDDYGHLAAIVERWPVMRVELASVAGAEIQSSLEKQLSTTAGGCIVQVETRHVQCGVRNSYADPRTMGVDRWLAMIAAHNAYPGGVVIVDAGTALTVDYVAPEGDHIGGYILPGVAMMRKALGNSTARVHTHDEAAAAITPGKSTTECVHQGLGWLWSSLGGRLERDRRAYGLNHIVVTGGDRTLMAGLIEADVTVEADLVFQGMDLACSESAEGSG